MKKLVKQFFFLGFVEFHPTTRINTWHKCQAQEAIERIFTTLNISKGNT
jgi:hypothetical protein